MFVLSGQTPYWEGWFEAGRHSGLAPSSGSGQYHSSEVGACVKVVSFLLVLYCFVVFVELTGQETEVNTKCCK